VLRDQYTKMAVLTADLRQQGLRTETALVPMDNAAPPRSPKFPNVRLILVGSLGLGFGLGLFTALIVELLRRRVRGAEDLAIADVPVLGVINPPPAGLLAFS